jgi:hypothetical protein
LVTLSATRCFYYFFMVVVIRHKTKATACRALTFIVRIFVNDTIAIAVWTSFDTITIAVWISFHLCVPRSDRAALAARGRLRRAPAQPEARSAGPSFFL